MAAKTEEELFSRLMENTRGASPYKEFYITSKLFIGHFPRVDVIYQMSSILVDFKDIPGNDYCVMQHSNK